MLKKALPFLLFLFLSIHLFSQNDSIKLKSGQILLGTIESLDKSILVFSTPFSDSDFKIKWEKVTEFYSEKTYIVTLEEGGRYNTTINTDPSNNNNVIIFDDNGSQITTNISNITFIDPFSKNFLKRVDYAFDAGVNFTKAKNFQQITGNAKIGYTAEDWNFLTTFNLVFSSQDATDDISRFEADLSGQRFLPKEWYLLAGANFLSNSDQQLKLRSTGRVGAGYFFIKNNNLYFGSDAGVAFNNESYTDVLIDSKSSMEAYLSSEFNRYNMGDLSLLTSVRLSPSITENGRFRTDFKLDLKYDLTGSIYLKTGITYNYDNQPISDSPKGDYVFQTTIGWDNN